MNINKTVRLGRGRNGNVFCKVEYKDGRLSVSGVEGPTRDGNCKGSCGQIEMSLDVAAIDPAPGWDRAKIERFIALWRKWHLNNLRAGCEHQRGAAWESHEVEFVTYTVDWTANYHLERDARKDAEAQGRKLILTDRESLKAATKFSAAAAILLAINNLGLRPFEQSVIDEARLEQAQRRVPQFAQFAASAIKRKVERKQTNWLRQSEHADGLLCKPCEVCGYKYGTEWKFEAVPDEVLVELNALPDTDVVPAWV